MKLSNSKFTTEIDEDLVLTMVHGNWIQQRLGPSKHPQRTRDLSVVVHTELVQ
jgi:hypothetical protein